MPTPAPADRPAGAPEGAAVLLVDDRPENLLALEAVLAPLARETGARLLRAGGADEALRHVLREDGAIAVVLLDVMMPGTDGLQTAHLIRARRATEHVPIIFVTALDADRLEVRHDALTTGAVVAAAVTLVQPQATSKGVRLLDLDAGEAGVPFLGDEHRVRQVLVNLLSNAVKFTPHGGSVTVRSGSAEEPAPAVWAPSRARDAAADGQPSWAFVHVEDTGPGIAAGLLAELFEPFVQGDGALTREQGGTGLGLAISRRLARLMGGDGTVRNRPDSGAVFTLWLPGAAAAGPRAARGAADARGRPTPARSLAAIGDAAAGPMSADAYTVLHAMSVRLAAGAETIAERYVAALRADGRFPGARELPNVQLRDHATPFVGLLASQLMIIGETRGTAPDLLRDGDQVQRAMAELHGAQRHRLGWSEADVERESALLVAEVERTLRSVADAGADAPPADAARVATQYALDVARHVLEQAMRTALRAHRIAREADTP